MLLWLPVNAQDSTERDARIKGAFVFNFAKLVSASTPASSVYRMCVSGAEAVAEVLEQGMASRRIGSASVVVDRRSASDALDDCQLVYLGPATAGRIPAVHASLAERPVLRIDEGRQFSFPDGMIRLFRDADRYRFQINLDAVARAGLTAESKLVALGEVVQAP